MPRGRVAEPMRACEINPRADVAATPQACVPEVRMCFRTASLEPDGEDSRYGQEAGGAAARSLSGGGGGVVRLAEGQHQAIGPGEERCGLRDVEDLQVGEAEVAEAGDGLDRGRHRGARELDGELDDGLPALAKLQGGDRADTLVEQPIDVRFALAELGREPRVDRGAIDAAVEARGRGGGELALGAGGAAVGVE